MKLGVYIASHNNPMFLRHALLQLEAQSVLPATVAIHENGHPESSYHNVIADVLIRLHNKDVQIMHDHTPAGLSHPYFHYLPLKRLLEYGDCNYFTKFDHDDIFYENHLETLKNAVHTQRPNLQWVGQRRADVLVLNSKQYLYRYNREFVWNPLGGPSDSFMFNHAVADEYLNNMMDRAGTGEADDWILHKYTLPKFPNGRMLEGKATMCYVSHGRNDSTAHWVVKPPDELAK